MSRQAAGQRRGGCGEPWLSRCCLAAWPLALDLLCGQLPPHKGMWEKVAAPGFTEHSVLKPSNKWHCSYLANYRYLSLYLECIHLEPSNLTHCDMMNVYVMGRRVLQRRNLALSIVRRRKPWVIRSVPSHRFIIYIFILKRMFILYVKDYEANQQLEISHLILRAPHGNVVFKFNMAYAKGFKTNGSVVVAIKIIKMSCFKYISNPDWRGAQETRQINAVGSWARKEH